VTTWVERRYARWSGWYEGYQEKKIAVVGNVLKRPVTLQFGLLT